MSNSAKPVSLKTIMYYKKAGSQTIIKVFSIFSLLLLESYSFLWKRFTSFVTGKYLVNSINLEINSFVEIIPYDR